MSRGLQTFRERDLVRAIKATRAAGVEHYEIEITAGKITIKVGGKASEANAGTNEWDDDKDQIEIR